MSFYKIKLVTEAGVEINCDFELSEEDEKTINQYYCEYQRIIDSDILKEGLKISGQFKWDFQGNWSIDGELPDDNKIALLLHFIRPFILNDEKCNFNRVVNIFSKNINCESIRDKFVYFKELYKGKDMQRLYTLSFDGIIINSEEFFEKWINSYEYHRDENKRSKLDDIHKYFPKEYTKYHVVSILLDKLRAIALLGKFIGLLLKKYNGIRI